MRVSKRWLNEYVDTNDIGDVELAERLTLAGIEVESVEAVQDYPGVVVGRVLSVEEHPNADRLRVCQVQAGSGEGGSPQVVCGAPNVRPGLMAPFALPGAQLPGGEVTRAKLRGVDSCGMLLSRAELGLEARSEGLWELPEGLLPGQTLSELLEAPDTVFDLKITSNRPDLLGLHGVAREVAVLLDRPLREPLLDYPESSPAAAEFLELVVEVPEECPRYIARVIRGLSDGHAPLWMAARLTKAGMRPVSLVVDITNYTMLELGHPLHAFDRERLPGRRIGVRRARQGERLRTLDGVERELGPEVLLITADDTPIALAGVMGGEATEMGAQSSSLVLEAACFDPICVRRSARAVGLRSEASLRFERGLSPEAADRASRRCCALLAELGGGVIASGAEDAYPRPADRRIVKLRRGRVSEVVGAEISEEENARVLGALGLKMRPGLDGWTVEVPWWRGDLEREIDLVEEVARVYGFHRIGPVPPRVPPALGGKDDVERYIDRARSVCASLGLDEAITWPLAPEAEAEVLIRNPMARGEEGLRASLLPGLMKVVRTTFEAQAPGAALFEVGRVFLSRGEEIVERERLGVVLAGRSGLPLAGKEIYKLEEAKGLLDALLAALRVPELEVAPCADVRLHPGRRAALTLDGESIGWIGEVAPELCAELPGRRRVFAFELELAPLLSAVQSVDVRPVPSFPVAKRDLSLVAPRQVAEATVRAAVRSEPLVEQCVLYDLYEGEGMEPGVRSLTYEITFRHPERTLSSEEVEGAIGRIVERLRQHDVRLRT